MSSSAPSVPASSDEEIPSLLGPGSRFDGLLSFRGAARVEGALTGEVHARGRLVIGPRAEVRARVDVDELVVAGTLEGEIQARERAELGPTARVQGRLRTPRLSVAEGGLLDGHLETGPQAGQGAETEAGPGAAPSPAAEASAGAVREPAEAASPAPENAGSA